MISGRFLTAAALLAALCTVMSCDRSLPPPAEQSKPRVSVKADATEQQVRSSARSRDGVRAAQQMRGKLSGESGVPTSATTSLADDTTSPETSATQLEQLSESVRDMFSTLTEQLRMNPDMTTDVLRRMMAETDPELVSLMAQAIADAAPVIGKRLPVDLLLRIALHDPMPERRQAALYILSQAQEITSEMRQELVSISMGDTSMDVRVTAIAAMGAWMNRDRQLAEGICADLVAARDATDNPMVRGFAIQTIANMDMPLGEKLLGAMTESLNTEPVAQNRSLAALALGCGVSPDNQQQVLTNLEQAYMRESDLQTRRHIITEIARAGMDKAPDVLNRLPAPDNLLSQDVADYVEILRSGKAADFDAVWKEKSQRDDSRGTYPGSDDRP